ncbi:MAG: bifunctional riboflavin kinase/FAD synthetase [Gemmatimonadetes bacterium]|nr:bifunctional riboflavin kinase/FAD synthetase [Gemmatimonadota bacterium]
MTAPEIPVLSGGGATAATVGNFDGVHVGHRALIDQLSLSAARGLKSLLVTFDRHPAALLRPEAAPPLLTTPAEKKELLAATGLDYLAVMRFDAAFAALSPRAFVVDVLLERLRVRHIVVGRDHGFGRGRSGDVDSLRRFGSQSGFTVGVAQDVEIAGQRVSSSAAREALLRGDVGHAATILGRPYSLTGEVVRGQGRGRKIGFPTANLAETGRGKLIPLAGVYAAHAEILSGARGPGGRWPALVHLGPKPVFGEKDETIEAWLLDFDGDLYGCDLRVEFVARLRGIEDFRGVEELKEAVRSDKARARAIFAGSGRGLETRG